MNQSRRGGVYIAVLGVTLFVTLVGLSAMVLVQTERDIRDAVSESRIARTDARSAMEIALSRVAANPDWRTAHPDGVWTESKSLGDTTWGYVLDYDDTTPADEAVDISLTVGARRASAARFYSVDAIVPPPGAVLGPNAVTNSDFESGVSPWYSFMSTVESESAEAHSGSMSLRCHSRWFANGGAHVSVKDGVADNTEYQVTAWVFLPDGVTDRIRFVLHWVNIVPGEDEHITGSVVGGAWVQVSGTLYANWADGATPGFVTLMVEARDSTTEFLLDDVELRAVTPASGQLDIQPVAGSFRQRVLE